MLLVSIVMLTAFLSSSLHSQSRARPFCHFSSRDGWTDEGSDRVMLTWRVEGDHPSGIPQVIENIKKTLSFDYNFDVFISQEENFANALAAVAQNRRIVVFGPKFLDSLNLVAGTEWAAIAVIAHEVGHHIAGFGDDPHENELNADYWAGQVLQRLGSSKSAAQRSMLTIGDERDTATHPNKQRRARTIGQGWDDAYNGNIDYSFCISCQ